MPAIGPVALKNEAMPIASPFTEPRWAVTTELLMMLKFVVNIDDWISCTAELAHTKRTSRAVSVLAPAMAGNKRNMGVHMYAEQR